MADGNRAASSNGEVLQKKRQGARRPFRRPGELCRHIELYKLQQGKNMNLMHPPKMATWLMKRFGCSADNDALIGDLAEHYARGKSAPWYWRQVLVAIVATAFSEVRGHKWLT